MTVQWFKIKITGSNSAKLENIRSWIITQIDVNDLADRIGDGSVKVFYDDIDETNVLIAQAFFKGDVMKTKYPALIKDALLSLNKDGLDTIRIEKYDDCSHDSDNPQPCVSTEVYSWP